MSEKIREGKIEGSVQVEIDGELFAGLMMRAFDISEDDVRETLARARELQGKLRDLMRERRDAVTNLRPNHPESFAQIMNSIMWVDAFSQANPATFELMAKLYSICHVHGPSCGHASVKRPVVGADPVPVEVADAMNKEQV